MSELKYHKGYNTIEYENKVPTDTPKLARRFALGGPRYFCYECQEPLSSIYQKCDKCQRDPMKIIHEFKKYSEKKYPKN